MVDMLNGTISPEIYTSVVLLRLLRIYGSKSLRSLIIVVIKSSLIKYSNVRNLQKWNTQMDILDICVCEGIQFN